MELRKGLGEYLLQQGRKHVVEYAQQIAESGEFATDPEQPLDSQQLLEPPQHRALAALVSSQSATLHSVSHTISMVAPVACPLTTVAVQIAFPSDQPLVCVIILRSFAHTCFHETLHW